LKVLKFEIVSKFFTRANSSFRTSKKNYVLRKSRSQPCSRTEYGYFSGLKAIQINRTSHL
jgi:hypothetical protein